MRPRWDTSSPQSRNDDIADAVDGAFTHVEARGKPEAALGDRNAIGKNGVDVPVRLLPVQRKPEIPRGDLLDFERRNDLSPLLDQDIGPLPHLARLTRRR